MVKFTLSPQFGVKEASASVFVSLSGLPDKARSVWFENITNKSVIGEHFDVSAGSVDGKINLNIPNHSSHSAVCVVAHVESESNELLDLCSSVYNVTEPIDAPRYSGVIRVSPMFVGPDEETVLEVFGEPNSRVAVSINDARFMVGIPASGRGTMSVYGRDVMDDKESKVMQRFHVKALTQKDGYTTSLLTGSYLHVLPSKISALANCDVSSLPSAVTLSEDPANFSSLSAVMPGPTDGFPFTGIPAVSFAEKDGLSSSQKACRVNDFSMASLSNGMVVYAAVGGDQNESNAANGLLNRVFLNTSKSSAVARSSPLRYGSIAPSSVDRQVELYVEHDIFNYSTINDSVVVLTPEMGYASCLILEKIPGDEYNPFDRLVLLLQLPQSNILQWLIWVPYVVLPSTLTDPSAVINPAFVKLPYVSDIDNNEYSVVKASIATSESFIGENNESFVYVVAQSVSRITGLNNLFLYGLNVLTQGSGSSFSPQSSEWLQLTSIGDNKNPSAFCDKTGNLHVFWDSDRSGSSQVYYGMIGPSMMSCGLAAISSAFDKYAEASQAIEKPAVWLSEGIISVLDDPDPLHIDKLCDAYSPNTMWMPFVQGAGSAYIPHNGTFSISCNTLNDQAVVFTTLDIDNNGNLFNGFFKQLGYEVSFDLKDEKPVDILSDHQIDLRYTSWKSKFASEHPADSNASNIFSYNNNDFVLEREDRYYDRFIPIFGSYKNETVAQSFSDCLSSVSEKFAISLTGDDSNVRHFVVGLMPEKTRFRARNTKNFSEYCADNSLSESECESSYIVDDVDDFWTGRYRLVVLMNTIEPYPGEASSRKYGISRRISEPFTLAADGTNFKFVSRYSKLYKEDVAAWVNADQSAPDSYTDTRCLSSVLAAVDGNVVFSESFLVDVSEQYREFNLGFGVPGSGQYTSATSMPYGTNVFENADIAYTFANVKIGKPMVSVDESVATIPTAYCDMSSMLVTDSNDELTTSSYFDVYSRINLGVSTLGFLQVPITFLGANKSPGACLGPFGLDLHVAWESNRDKQWDIFYTSNNDRALPFRNDTRITNTASNSIMPSVSISPSGRRLVAWQDNRSGLYQIYAAYAEPCRAGSKFCVPDSSTLASQAAKKIITVTGNNGNGTSCNMDFSFSLGSCPSVTTVVHCRYDTVTGEVICGNNENNTLCGLTLDASGGDAGYSETFTMASTTDVINLTFSFATYHIKDRLLITSDSGVNFDSGCVSTSSTGIVSETLVIPIGTTSVTITVIPNCEGTSGTAWTLTADCA